MSSFVKVCVGDHPGIWDDLGALFQTCPGIALFWGRCIVGTYDSVAGAAVAPEEEGGQPTLPLTAVLPDAAMRLWTTVAATDAEVSTG